MNPFRKIRALFRKEKLDAEMAEEMRSHLERQIEANLAAGMLPDEARYAARRQFGGVEQLKERARDQRGWMWFEQTIQDLVYAVRQLRRNPGFTAAIMLILALGIGANTAVFSVMDALLFRPLPVKDPAGLLAVMFINPQGTVTNTQIAAPHFQTFRAESHSFSEFIGFAPIHVRLRTGEIATERVLGSVVSGNYFAVLDVKPILGRVLSPMDDEVPGRDTVAVISYECWQSFFGGDPDVIGKTLHVNDQPLTIIGVAPSEFSGLNSHQPAQFWVPIAMERVATALQPNLWVMYDMVGRLAPGVTRAQAVAELEALTIHMADIHGPKGPAGYERYGRLSSGFRPRLLPAALGSWDPHQGGRDNMLKLAALFGSAVALVLLVACANAANLLLVRGLARRREIAVRLSLGATRLRLVRQLVVESLLLSFLAAAFGVLLAQWGIAGLMSLRTGMLSWVVIEPHLDGRVLAFTAGLATITGLIFGLMPAAGALRFDLYGTLKQETSAAFGRPGRFAPRNLLVLTQVAVGLVLLSGAGLCLRSFAKLVTVDPGFDTRNVLTAEFSLDPKKYPTGIAPALVQQLLKKVAAAPGVRAVSLADGMLPLSNSIARRPIGELAEYAMRPGENVLIDAESAGPWFFRLLAVPVVYGREFDERDVRGRPEVVLVNESFVRRYWPGQNPLGKRIAGAEVVGVVADTRSEQVWLEPRPRIYSALLQDRGGGFTLLVKTEGDPTAFAAPLRREVEALDKFLKLERINTLRNIWSASLAGQRMILMLLAVFSVIALLLAAVGLYAFVAFSIVQRTREIGIRVAIGAQRRDIMALVLRQGMTLVGAGLAIGLGLALLATRALERVLYDITPTDVPTFAGVLLLLAIMALLACWFPARRVAKVDPMVALRAE